MISENSDNTIKVRDKDEDALHALFNSSENYKCHFKTAYEELALLCRQKKPPPSKTLFGIKATHYLRDIIQIATDSIILNHNCYGSVRWLWYLRRLPDKIFAGTYNTTIAYDRLLAEVITGYFHENDELDCKNPSLCYPINRLVFCQICFYIAKIKFLSTLHSLYRKIGKGLVLNTASPFLDCIANAEIEEAIKMYDSRHDVSFDFQASRVGLANLQNVKDGGRLNIDTPTACLFFYINPKIEVPILFSDGNHLKSGIGFANFFPSILELNKILNPISNNSSSSIYLEKISSLIQLHLILPMMLLKHPTLLGRLLQVGYFSINEDLLRNFFDKYIWEVNDFLIKNSLEDVFAKNYEDWMNNINNVPANTWPLKVGKITRRIDGQIILDFVSSSAALIQNIQLDRSPLMGNSRAELFEMECQDLINNSTWKPSCTIENLRGKTLRKDSILITDIDAIGEYGKTLLIISCKSIIYDDDYDKGTYKAVKNIQSTVDAAVVHWDGIIETFKRIKSGDNYDFTKYENIIGVVCTPFVAFSPDPFTYRNIDVANLKACISSYELSEWLKTDPVMLN